MNKLTEEIREKWTGALRDVRHRDKSIELPAKNWLHQRNKLCFISTNLKETKQNFQVLVDSAVRQKLH